MTQINSQDLNVDVDVDLGSLREAISKEYELVAADPDQGFHFHTGRRLTKILGYQDRWLDGIPESSIESFAGTGNPFSLGEITSGQRVVDIGCGAGIDSLIAAKKVGATGQVIGVDMTQAMLAKAEAACKESGMAQVEFKEAYAEELPVDADWADVVISNGVFNLLPGKVAAMREWFRVLKPGGRLQIGDILVQKEVPADAKLEIDLWTGWIAGALLEAELKAVVEAAGFVDFEITWREEVFKDAPQESSAAAFGTLGINFRARKPGD